MIIIIKDPDKMIIIIKKNIPKGFLLIRCLPNAVRYTKACALML